jgi:phospholipase/carboxylesterase
VIAGIGYVWWMTRVEWWKKEVFATSSYGALLKMKFQPRPVATPTHRYANRCARGRQPFAGLILASFMKIARWFFVLLFGVLPMHAYAGAPSRLEIPLTHRPDSEAATGLQRFGEKAPGGLFYVPHSYHSNEPLPLLILLHGRGRSPWDWFGSYSKRAEAGRFIIVAPESSSRTWGSSTDFGPDVPRINHALAAVFSRYAIDRDRIIIGGLSDGASYALSLGLANGDRIRGVIAYSPGYIIGRQGRGRPPFFVSHGLRDAILPVTTTRRLVSYLRSAGYAVDYHEFNGGHEVPAAISDAAMTWVKAIFQKNR